MNTGSQGRNAIVIELREGNKDIIITPVHRIKKTRDDRGLDIRIAGAETDNLTSSFG